MSPLLPQGQKKPTTFLDLPREIRQNILSRIYSHTNADEPRHKRLLMSDTVKDEKVIISTWVATLSKVAPTIKDDIEFVAKEWNRSMSDLCDILKEGSFLGTVPWDLVLEMAMERQPYNRLVEEWAADAVEYKAYLEEMTADVEME